jgi:hypothetical protein
MMLVHACDAATSTTMHAASNKLGRDSPRCMLEAPQKAVVPMEGEDAINTLVWVGEAGDLFGWMLWNGFRQLYEVSVQ